MPRFRRAAKRILAPALALIASLAWLPASSTAWAQADPFELPSGVNADTVSRAGTPGLSEIIVDGHRRPRMVYVEWLPHGGLSINTEDARAAGIEVPRSLKGKVALDDLGVASWTYDGARQTLIIKLLRKSDGANLIDLGTRQATDGESAAVTWARLNYDTVATVSTRSKPAFGGLFEAAVGRGNAFAATTFTLRYDPVSGTALTRLDSVAQVTFPQKAIVATLGDVITAGSGNQRSFRIGGIQIASDYSLRPDLITAPLPAFSGRVSVPTVIDIISAGQRTRIGAVEPGEFTVRNVPLPGGRGDAAIVVRDELGRETVQNVRFYATPELLAPGIRQFAVNIGAVRRRYGQINDTYDQLAATGFYRRGLSSFATLTASGETTRGLVNFGGRLDAALGGLVLASVETRASRSAKGAGAMINLALESSGAGFSGRVALAWPTAGYRDVAAELGDPAPPRSITGQLSYSTGRTAVQIAAGSAWRLRDPAFPSASPRTSFVDASARFEASQRISFSAAASYRRDVHASFAATFGISVRFGRQSWAGASVTQRTDYPLIAAASYRRMATAASPLGYDVSLERSRADRLSGGITWRLPTAELNLRGEYEKGVGAVRLNARGSLILAGGQVFARSRSSETFALVRAGRIAGLTVRHNHQPVGRTGRRGLILVDGVMPFIASDFEIDPDKLPADVVARVFERRVVIPRRTIGLVALDAIRYIPRPVQIVGLDGLALEPGTRMIARPSGDLLIVGFDGFVETNGAGRDRSIETAAGSAMACRFELPPPLARLSAGPTPKLECRPLVIAPAGVIARAGDARQRRVRPVN